MAQGGQLNNVLQSDNGKYYVAGVEVSIGGGTVSGNPINFSVDGSVAATPVNILKIKCNTGSGVVLTLYDNASAASGTTLFTSAAMVAGVEFVIPGGLQTINGVFADVTGAGTFTIEVE